MHQFRLRYTALGLLTFLQLVTSTSSCVTSYDDHDVVTRTLISTIVFEGLAYRDSLTKDGFVNWKFRVLRMAKGRLPRERNNPDKYRSATVGEFASKSDPTRCVASRNHVTRSRIYLVFLNTTERSYRLVGRGGGDGGEVSNRRKSKPSTTVSPGNKSHFSGADRLRKAVFLDDLPAPPPPPRHDFTYYLGAFPILSNDRLFNLATANNCSSCVGKPKIMKISPDRTILAGKKVRFHCRMMGYPLPDVMWFKNGIEVDEEQGRISIKMKNQTSILQIKKTTMEDSGSYQCQAFNFAGSSNTRRSRLFVSTENEKVFVRRCIRQTLCFNGGICYQLSTSIATPYCECDGDYVGDRCEQKNVGYNPIIGRKKRRSLHKKKLRFLFIQEEEN